MTADQLAKGPLEEILKRVSSMHTTDPKAESALFAAALGGFELPKTTILEAANEMANYRPQDVANKNLRQKKGWANRYKRAANAFVEVISDKPIIDITSNDIRNYEKCWQKRVDNERVTSDYAKKHLGYLRSIIVEFYKSVDVEEYVNPFSMLKGIERTNREKHAEGSEKLEFTPKWIKETLIDQTKIQGLNQQARDILIICAETGCRQTEIYDVPASAIFLDASVPYFNIRFEADKDDAREIKNRSSIRPIPLIGAALEAMKRNPDGFPAYRGNANFSNTANKFFKENDLLPSPNHKISGIRHSFETRLIRARVESDDRGYMMGHSVKKMRGREKYGNATDLKLRALFCELIAFPTTDWHPRASEEVWDEIYQFLEAEGHRPRRR
ncbi:hypothetical protein [Roseovarius nanhaiticus]|uniref:hypothetical protein n=1 Tax=Roseovarius nanhaiticus TaxID=573024 RepID=UPI002491F3DD|nr:hypothetical protein [Roseovarius nanhaiticus]